MLIPNTEISSCPIQQSKALSINKEVRRKSAGGQRGVKGIWKDTKDSLKYTAVHFIPSKKGKIHECIIKTSINID